VIVTDSDLDDLLTLKETAARLNCHPHTLDRWIKDRKLDSVKIGGRRYVTRRAILAFVNSGVERAS
jgi:excisionase family DNA binding protein